MAPALVLILFGLLGPIAMLQWRGGRWLGAARWIARRLSPQFIAGVPMAGILVMAIGLSILWPPGIVLVFLAAAGFLWAVFAVAQRREQQHDRKSVSRQEPPQPDTRSVPGTPPGRARQRPQSP
jgi:peptidoglycan/LPS O-acetylase OafA/YrhL